MTTTPLLVSLPVVANRGPLCEPVTVGMPFPAGLVREECDIHLSDEMGQAIALQARATDRWADGSIRWALLDFLMTGEQARERQFTVHMGASTGPLPVSAPLTLEITPRKITIDTGVASFVVKTGPACPFASVHTKGVSALGAAGSQFIATTPDGRTLETRVTRVTVEEQGAVRATVRIDGSVGPPRHPSLLLTARVQFVAGSAAVRVAVTLRNVKRAHHQGGIWELGDAGSVYLRDVSLRLALPSAITRADCAPELDAALQSWPMPVELYQDSSGGEHWHHPAHVDRHGDIPCTFRGYRLQSSGRRIDGLRATPLLMAWHATGVTGVAVEHFWQNWPKAIAIESDAIIWRLFPGHTANEHELQGGEQKTHRGTLIFGDDACSRDAGAWGRAPASARLTPDWYCSSRAVGPLTCAGTDRYQQLVNAAIEGEDSLLTKREAADEYGWRHFGDLYADHENAFSGLETPVVSHYNNQYDAIAGFALQFMRSGDSRWHAMMNELAWHVTDIDIYHTDRDKSAYNHGLFWHTAHYVTAGRSSHRSFPKDPRVSGGGPGNEHNYTAGLRLHWLLTGDPQSREAAIELATWVIQMDDGRRTVLRWLSGSSTGLASQTFSPSFHGPGRGAGHSILALLDGHRLTQNPIYLEKAEQLVRRCIHPSDDIERMNLLDAERRWSYTVFLQVLARYLDYRVELGLIDSQYAYGRAALLHYARWMVDHEYPYLEKPAILEYPTETWAAQDMRKCDVFLFAAGHACGEDRRRFLDGASRFFEYSVSTLHELPTRTLARPLVLMLTNGYLHLSPDAAAPRPEGPVVSDFGAPSMFVPQKALVKRRIAMTACAAFMVITATVLALI
jgi:hypothetical protein